FRSASVSHAEGAGGSGVAGDRLARPRRGRRVGAGVFGAPDGRNVYRAAAALAPAGVPLGRRPPRAAGAATRGGTLGRAGLGFGNAGRARGVDRIPAAGAVPPSGGAGVSPGAASTGPSGAG